jgi:maleate isomerase
VADTVVRVGVLTPHAAVGPEAELPAMATGRVVVHLARVLGEGKLGDPASDPVSATDLQALLAPRFLDRALELLPGDAVDVIGSASTTTAYAIGFEAEAAVVSSLAERAGRPVAATCASAVSALHVLGVERVALVGAPWFDPDFNRLGARYFSSQGFEVVSSTSAQLSHDPQRIEPAAVYEWTSRHVGDDAEAVFIGGNGFRAVAAIARLEAALARPVLTSNQVLLWNLLALTGASLPVKGYGRLFVRSP